MRTDPSSYPRWTLTDKLRKAREHAGMEQTELAAAIGVSRTTIVNYERGNVAPRKLVLRAWAAATGVATSWLEHDSDVLVGTYEENLPAQLSPEVMWAAVAAAVEEDRKQRAALETTEAPVQANEGSDTVRHQGLEPRTRWFGALAPALDVVGTGAVLDATPARWELAA